MIASSIARLVCLLMLVGWPLASVAQNAPPKNTPSPSGKSAQTATIRMLNKLTLEVSSETVPINGERKFGKMRVKILSCYRYPNSDAVAFLQIWDGGKQRKNPSKVSKTFAVKNDDGETRIFSGWMFSSSPVLNPLNHFIYDVWLLGCKS